MAQTSSYGELPELVRDSQLVDTTLHPDPYLPKKTIHTKSIGRTTWLQEVWVRERQLGYGGFGTVWLERRQPVDPTTSYELRAVKRLGIQTNGERPEDYARELEALAKFSQEKFVTFFAKFHGWYESSGLLFIAMDYYEHGDLRHYLHKQGPLPEAQAQDIVWQILQGLNFMHDNKFAHRDLKPANILIKNKPPESGWHIKICDLGLSKRVQDRTVVATTRVQGTKDFMPPELALDLSRKADSFAVDMWSLGATSFQILTNKAAFNTLQLYDYKHGRIDFPRMPLEEIGASQAAIRFIMSIMLLQPSERLSARQASEHDWIRRPKFHSVPSISQQEQQPQSRQSAGYTNSGTELVRDWSSTVSSRKQTSWFPNAEGNVDTLGTDHGSVDSNVKTLRVAAEKGQGPDHQRLVPERGDIDQKDDDAMPLLPTATMKGDEVAIPVLIEEGQGPDHQQLVPEKGEVDQKDDDGMTSLPTATMKGDEVAIPVLLENGASIESKDGYGNSALGLAAWNDDKEEVIQELINKGANIESKNYKGRSPLGQAVWKDHEKVFRALLENGANIESKDDYGDSPLGTAAWKGHDTIIRELIKKGANIESKNHKGRSPLGQAAWRGREIATWILIKEGADIESKDIDGNSPLALAAWNNHEFVMQALISVRADIESKNKKGHTALTIASLEGNEAAKQVLIKSGAKKRLRDRWYGVLH